MTAAGAPGIGNSCAISASGSASSIGIGSSGCGDVDRFQCNSLADGR